MPVRARRFPRARGHILCGGTDSYSQDAAKHAVCAWDCVRQTERTSCNIFNHRTKYGGCLDWVGVKPRTRYQHFSPIHVESADRWQGKHVAQRAWNAEGSREIFSHSRILRRSKCKRDCKSTRLILACARD